MPTENSQTTDELPAKENASLPSSLVFVLSPTEAWARIVDALKMQSNGLDIANIAFSSILSVNDVLLSRFIDFHSKIIQNRSPYLFKKSEDELQVARIIFDILARNYTRSLSVQKKSIDSTELNALQGLCITWVFFMFANHVDVQRQDWAPLTEYIDKIALRNIATEAGYPGTNEIFQEAVKNMKMLSEKHLPAGGPPAPEFDSFMRPIIDSDLLLRYYTSFSTSIHNDVT